MLCSAGSSVPWLDFTQHDVLLASNSSQDVTLSLKSQGITAGTYRAQLCLFTDYNYSEYFQPTLAVSDRKTKSC